MKARASLFFYLHILLTLSACSSSQILSEKPYASINAVKSETSFRNEKNIKPIRSQEWAGVSLRVVQNALLNVLSEGDFEITQFVEGGKTLVVRRERGVEVQNILASLNPKASVPFLWSRDPGIEPQSYELIFRLRTAARTESSGLNQIASRLDVYPFSVHNPLEKDWQQSRNIDDIFDRLNYLIAVKTHLMSSI